MKNYKVYLIRDKNRNIVYVGLTSHSLKKRYDDHVYRQRINREYMIELVQDYLTLEQAATLERMLIKQYDLVNTGLNRSYGTTNGSVVIHTESTKEYLSKINKGKKVSEIHASKNRIARLGQNNSQEHQAKIANAISKPVMCLETGTIYKSARHAAKELNLQYSKISLVCNGKRKTTGGLHFIFTNKK